jgi:hypothetical protein
MKKILVTACLFITINTFAQQGTVLVGNKDDNTLSFIDLRANESSKNHSCRSWPA